MVGMPTMFLILSRLALRLARKMGNALHSALLRCGVGRAATRVRRSVVRRVTRDGKGSLPRLERGGMSEESLQMRKSRQILTGFLLVNLDF